MDPLSFISAYEAGRGADIPVVRDETKWESTCDGGSDLGAEYRNDRSTQEIQKNGPTGTRFQLRRVELAEGQEAMLYKAGWRFTGPVKHKSTELGRYWVNPRSGMRYTQGGAVDLEELRESA